MTRSKDVVKLYHTLSNAEKAAGVSRRYKIRNSARDKTFVRIDFVPSGVINGVLVKGENQAGALFTLATVNLTGNASAVYTWKADNIVITTPVTAQNLTCYLMAYNEKDTDDGNAYQEGTEAV